MHPLGRRPRPLALKLPLAVRRLGPMAAMRPRAAPVGLVVAMRLPAAAVPLVAARRPARRAGRLCHAVERGRRQVLQQRCFSQVNSQAICAIKTLDVLANGRRAAHEIA